jgi:hypothetical protein
MNNCNLSKAFQSGQSFYCPFDKKTKYLSSYYLGDLVIISGEVVACDPLVFPETKPLITNIFPKNYPVILSLASHSLEVFSQNNPSYKTVICAMIRFKEREAIRWELIANSHNEMTISKENQYYGYPVDSGIGCFMDTQAAKIIIDSSYNSDTYEETISCQLDNLLDINNKEFMFANLLLDENSGLNVIAFSSGFGDGIYPTYLGFDNEGKIVNMVTQFASIDFKHLSKINYMK